MRRIKAFIKGILALFGYSAARNGRVSEDFKRVTGDSQIMAVQTLGNAWRHKDNPARQRELVETELAKYRKGEPNPAYDALTNILSAYVENLDQTQLLEIGCSSGYYSEVLGIKDIHAAYRGCDYSDAFIGMARTLYPEMPFDVEDATSLTYGDAEFDVVVSGGCILHIVDYERAITEAARVSRKYVIFHRTPVFHECGPIFYTKKAYGVDAFEIHFNEQKLVDAFYRNGLKVIAINTHSLSWNKKARDALAMKTYLCIK